MNFFDITIHDYLETIVEWVFEFYVFALALFWKSERRRHFRLLFPLGLAFILGASYGLAIFYHLFGNTVFGRTFVYLILFALAVAHLFLCFKKDLLKVILVGDFAYLVQNLTYKLFITVYVSVAYLGGGLSLSQIAYKIIYYAQFVFQAVVLYFLLIRTARKRMLENPLPNLVIAISAFTVIVSIFLSSLEDIHLQIISADIYQSPNDSIFLLRLGGYLMSILLNVAIIAMVFSSSRSDKLQRNIVDLQQVIDQSAKQYEISQQTIDSINIKCHDMKHRINKIVGGTLPEDAIRDINDTIAIYDALIDTGNKTLDVVLTEKSLTCESNGIAFTKTVDGSAIDFMSVGDVFCLFGNLLDNAIEATKLVNEKEKRYINLSLTKAGEGIVRIDIANYYQGERQFEKGLPLTTKEDKDNHGFGVKSVREIVHRYNGSISFATENGIFSVSIVFFAIG